MNRSTRSSVVWQSTRRTIRPALIAAVAATVLVGTGPAPAAIWDAGGSDTNWSMGLNWDDDNVPSSGENVEFGSAGGTATVDSNREAGTITFNRGASFTVDGTGTLTQNSSGINVSDANIYTISAPMELTGDGHNTSAHIWDVTSGGTLNLQDLASKDGRVDIYTKTGAGTATIDDNLGGAAHGYDIEEGTAELDSADTSDVRRITVGTDGGNTATFLKQGPLQSNVVRRIRGSGTFDNNGNSGVLADNNGPGLIMSGGEMTIRSGSNLAASGPTVSIEYQATANGGQATIGGDGELELQGGSERIFKVGNKSGLAVEMAVDAPIIDGGDTPTLFKRGAGTLAFNNANNDHAGPMNVENGALLVNGATTDGGNYTVGGAGNPATLGGTGTVGLASGNSVTVSADGIVAPGQSIGSLTLGGDTVFGDSSALSIELDSSGQSDVLNVNGALDLSGVGDTLELIDLGGAFDDSDYTIATFDAGTLTGQFDSVTGLDSSYNVVYDDSAGQINVTTTVIPEPGSLALLAPAGLLMLRRRRAA